jgi:MarR family transcriptional regulator, lower aerobic nicotinate degradation pathway regulator
MGAHIVSPTGEQSTSGQRVLDAIRQIVQALRISARRAEQTHGLSGAQVFVLQKLAEAPAVSLNELAEKTLTHQSSVSVVVQRLVSARLIVRRRSPSDRRRLELALTARGRSASSRGPDVAQHRLVAAVQSMQQKKQTLLAALMKELVSKAGFDAEATSLFFEEQKPKRANARSRKASKRGKS